MSNKIKRVFDIPYYQLKNNPLEDSLVTKYNGKWVAESTQSYLDKVNQMSKALLEIGIQKDDKIALISSRNRSEWHILDIAIQQIGAINVPVYPTISESDYEYIFNDSGVIYCFVSGEELFTKVNAIKDKISAFKGLYSFDSIKNCPNWKELLELGSKSTLNQELEEIKTSITPDDLATIIYTSGTTGNPKGVMLTHKNIVSNILNSQERIPPGLTRGLSFLPISHIFERMITYLYQKNSISIYFAESIDKIADNAKEINPDVMTVVPRLLEKVYDKIITKGQELTGLKFKLFFWAVELAENYTPFKNHGFFYDFKLSIARKLIFTKWQAALGGNIKVLVSGSAALQERLTKIFSAAGLPVLEGYGLSETSPVISVNALEKGMIKAGTVGKPIMGVDVKFDTDGEILVKGDNIMKGYYNDPEKTAEVFTSDGYFRTGDIGELTSEGLLRITDRKKEMFKTSGGKYIAPQIIENMVKQSRFIEQIMVVGADEKMPCALIQPDFDFLKSWIKLKGHQVDTSSNESIISNEFVIKRIQKVINQYNDQLGKWEQIKKITLTPNQWSIEDGHLTPTMKLKRKTIKEIYHNEYEKMYDRM
ncbi:MAG: AMP-dependent synthetase/ligase [Flavobacteriales bacterium]